MAGADLRLADDPRRRFRHRLPAEHCVRVLLVLVTELDALCAPVELGAGEADAEVAPVVPRQRARDIVRTRRYGEAAGFDHNCARVQDSAVAGRSAWLHESDRVCRLLPQERRNRLRQLAEDVRHEDEIGRTPSGRGVGLHPERVGRQLTSRRDHLRLRLDERQLLERRPGGDGRPGSDARPGADVEQRSRCPVRPLPLHLAEDGCCRCEGRRRAVCEIRGDCRAAARRTCPVLAAIGSREPLDLRLDGTARLTDEPLDRLGQLRWQRDGYLGWEGNAASTSSA